MRLNLQARMFFCILLIIICAPLAHSQIVINEIQSANSKTIADEDGDYSDWIELYNSGTTAIDLSGYGISDDESTPFKWTFPSVTVQAGAFLLIFASDKDRTSGTYLHLNFKIKSSGETIILTSPDGTTVDEAPATIIPQDESYGRKSDGTDNWYFFLVPTPGKSNTTTGYLGTLTPPVFSVSRGFYTSAQTVTLSSANTGATIRYTTDGSYPTSSSTAYSSAITVSAGSGTAIKTTIIRAACFKSGYTSSATTTNTYFIGSTAKTKYSTIPVVSLTTNYSYFYDRSTGIYTNYQQSGDDWERPVHVEFFEIGGSCAFESEAGVRINGSRTRDLPQKSLRLYADHQLGPGSFNYAIFPDSSITDYRRIILRNGGNDNDRYSSKFTLIRDGLMQSLVSGLDVDTQNYRPAIVFFDGTFYGIYGVVEREDKYYIKNHYPSVDEDELDMLEQLVEGNVEVDEGDNTAYNALKTFIASNDPGITSNYEYVKTKLDVNSVAINNLANIYFTNTDWPGNNIRFWRPRTDTGIFRWTICDTDWGFGLMNSSSHNTLQYASARGGNQGQEADAACLTLASLLRNREFRDMFINRMADMLNTVFEPTTVVSTITTMAADISPYISDHLTKWGSGRTVSNWNTNIQGLKDFANARPAYVRSQFVDFFHLSGTSTVTINVSDSSRGTVKFSTVGIPSTSYPWTGTYFNDTPIQVTAIPNSGYHFTGWQGAITGTQNPATITLSGDATITANFEVN